VSVYAPQWLLHWAAAVCDHTGVGWGDFAGPTRGPRVALAREVFAWLAREYRGPGNVRASFPDIAVVMGRDRASHTTAVTAYSRARHNPEAHAIAAEVHKQVKSLDHAQADPLAIADMTGFLEWVVGAGPPIHEVQRRARATLLRVRMADTRGVA